MIKEKSRYVNAHGILCEVNEEPITKVVSFDDFGSILGNLELMQNPYNDGRVIPIRTSNIPDSVWNRMVTDYNNAILAKVATDKAAQEQINLHNTGAADIAKQNLAANAATVLAEQKAAEERLAESRALAQQQAAAQNLIRQKQIADANATQKAKVEAAQPALAPVTKAMDTFFATDAEAQKAVDLAAQIKYNDYQKAQATKKAAQKSSAAVLAAKKAIDAGAKFPPSILGDVANRSIETAQTAADLGAPLDSYIPVPKELATSGNGASQLTTVAKAVAEVIAENERQGIISAGGDPNDLKKGDVTVKLGWFERIVNYIYETIY